MKRSESGSWVQMLEYALLVGLIGVLLIGSIGYLSGTITEGIMFSGLTSTGEAEQAIAGLPPAFATLHTPSELGIEESGTVTLTLRPSSESDEANAARGPRLSAELVGLSFEIVEVTDDPQAADAGGNSWIWQVKPNSLGRHQLVASVTAIIPDEVSDFQRTYGPYIKTIRVSESGPQLLTRWFDKMGLPAFTGAVSAFLGAIFVAIAAGVIALVKGGRRRKSSAESDSSPEPTPEGVVPPASSQESD